MAKNRERKQTEKSSKHQPAAVESDQKSDSGSDNDADNNNGADSPKLHVEFSEAEIIAPETNTVTFKVRTMHPLSVFGYHCSV